MATEKDRDEFRRISTRVAIPVKPLPKLPESLANTPQRKEEIDKFNRDLDDWRKSLVIPAASVTVVDRVVVQASQAATNTTGGTSSGTSLGRIPHLTNGKYYELVATTLDDGTVVPICLQTPHNTK